MDVMTRMKLHRGQHGPLSTTPHLSATARISHSILHHGIVDGQSKRVPRSERLFSKDNEHFSTKCEPLQLASRASWRVPQLMSGTLPQVVSTPWNAVPRRRLRIVQTQWASDGHHPHRQFVRDIDSSSPRSHSFPVSCGRGSVFCSSRRRDGWDGTSSLEGRSHGRLPRWTDFRVVCKLLKSGGSVCESNAPATGFLPPAGF